MIGAVGALGPSTSFALPLLEKKRKPNVVLIVCDDLNDYVTGLGGHPQARTPHIAKLAQTAVSFRRAYSNFPICAPSRSSFLTGIYPHTSKNMAFDKWYENPVLKNSRTIMEHFGANGYHVMGTGKVMHHFLRSVWSEFENEADYGPFVYDGKKLVSHPSVPKPFNDLGQWASYAPLSDSPYEPNDSPDKDWAYGIGHKKFNYVDEEHRDPTPDEINALWAANTIKERAKQENDQPFFLGVGFIRPHMPLHVPQRFFDMFPQDTLELPVIKPNDADDCYYAKVFGPEKTGLKYFSTIKASYPNLESGLKAFTQAYLACVTAVDDCIGQVIEAVDKSPLKDNTIIIVTSDHGWNMGEKDNLFKNTLWEESTRVPLIIRAPGVTVPSGIAEHPVSLIDLYPTLISLCGLEGDTRKNLQGAKLDGHSLVPFLKNPRNGTWTGPDAALSMTYGEKVDIKDPTQQHYSLRTIRWRYILYNNGSEELYDHDADPYEWTNLCDDTRYQKVKADLKAQLSRMMQSK